MRHLIDYVCPSFHLYARFHLQSIYNSLYGENDFAEGSKILPDPDLKIILLNHQNNLVETLKIISIAAKNFDILETGFNVLV